MKRKNALKKQTLLAALLLAALILSGCGASGTAPEKALPLKEAVEKAAPDAKELTPFSAEDLSDILGIEPEEYTEFVFLQEEGMGGREILAIRAASQTAAREIAQRMENYLEQRKRETRTYLPEVYQLLTATKVETKGLTVALFVGQNAAAEARTFLAGE